MADFLGGLTSGLQAADKQRLMKQQMNLQQRNLDRNNQMDLRKQFDAIQTKGLSGIEAISKRISAGEISREQGGKIISALADGIKDAADTLGIKPGFDYDAIAAGYGAAAEPEPEEFITDPKERFQAEKELRREYNTLNKNYDLVKSAYNRIDSLTFKGEGGAADMALIFNFMKMLDPTSTVRESEYATAANAAGVPQRIRAQWNALRDGNTLTPQMREDFQGRAKELFDAAEISKKDAKNRYTVIARNYKLDPKNLFSEVAPVPTDISKLTKGQWYDLGKHGIGRWDGKGFETAD